MLVAWALAAERDADPAGALTRLLALFDPDATLEFSRLDVIGTQWLPEVVRLALATGEPAVAAAATKACVREADTQAAPPVTAGAQHCQGLLDRDPAAVRAAAGQLQSFGFPLLSGQALENAAVLYAERATPRRPARPTCRPSASTAVSARTGTSCAPTPGCASTTSAAVGVASAAGRPRAGTP